MRFFNTAGPVNPEVHYCLPPLARLDLDDILRLIEQWKYFVLHAPRQTGKTSCLFALVDRLNATGQYRALYANVESAQSAREDVREAMRSILSEIGEMARDSLGDTFVLDRVRTSIEDAGAHGALRSLLGEWAASSPKPIVLMLDEVDALIGDTLIALLRQLRAGYTRRPDRFPQSIILCGVRDVRDYRIHSASEKTIITGGSAFNIKAESLRLGDFTREEMEQLYAQHTAATGQVFEPDAIDLCWELTEGQPWLVNALAYEVCWQMKEQRDRSRPITASALEIAKENLVLRRDTHLDQLADKLREERVRRVIEPLLTGEDGGDRLSPDDVQYVRDLGLISTRGQVRIANGIYQEVIPRELTYDRQVMIAQEPSWYIFPDGRLDMAKLMTAFQGFFQEHSEHWSQWFDYKEAGPQLLLQAFLQRIVNGGGEIHREYGLGRKRTDLLVVWPPRQHVHASTSPAEAQRFVLELKRIHHSLERTISEGLQQTSDYMDRCAGSEGHLILFSKDRNESWANKLFCRSEEFHGRTITVWGM